MALKDISAPGLPKLGTPHTFEELEQSFASLQAWLGHLNDDLTGLRDAVGQINVKNSLHTAVGDLPWTHSRFTGTAGTWTVDDTDMERLHYTILGQAVLVTFNLATTAITNFAADSLNIYLPEFLVLPGRGLTAGQQMNPTQGAGMVEWNDLTNGTNGIGFIQALGFGATTVTPPQARLDLYRIGPGNATNTAWPLTASLRMTGTVWFLINEANIPGL